MSLKKTLLTLLGAGAVAVVTYFGLKYATSKHQKIKILEEKGIVEGIVKIDTIDLDNDGVGEIIVEQEGILGGPGSPWHIFRIIDQKIRREILEYPSAGAKLIVKRPVEYVNGYKKLYLITPDNETLDVVFDITRQEYVTRRNKRKAETQVAREEKRASDLEERISQEPIPQEPTTFQQQSTEIADHRQQLQQLQQEETQEEDIFDSNWSDWEKRYWPTLVLKNNNTAIKVIRQRTEEYPYIFGDDKELAPYLIVEVEGRALKGTTTFDFWNNIEISCGGVRRDGRSYRARELYQKLNGSLRTETTVSDEQEIGSSRNATARRNLVFCIKDLKGVLWLVGWGDSAQIGNIDN
ncbi:MAG: hypothetical protein QXI41_00925 [Candidatus Pacearchaeota archaeon]